MENSTEDFVNVITELLDFKEYFTDEEQSAKLICYLVDEWGMSQLKARFLVRRITPFVLARMGQLSGVIGESASNKIQAYLSSFDWLFNLSQKLLDLLKTKHDKTFENTLAKPNQDDLNAITEDNKLWESLKLEYQGLVQLLLGQKELLSGLDYIKDQLDKDVKQIIEELSFSLNLKSPSAIITKAETASAANQLVYTHRQVPLVGRDEQLQKLDTFFDQDVPFSWWAITGAGGTGKSRLALEALLKREQEEGDNWELGFLPREKLYDPDALSHWQQKKATIIVIDYAGEHPNAVDHILAHFIQHQKKLAYPVRLLLLERYSKNQDWWSTLLKEGSHENQQRLECLFNSQPEALEKLSITHQKTLLEHFLTVFNSDVSLPEDLKHSFWKDCSHLSSEGRPLFIGMIALAIYKKGTQNIRHWTQKDLLKNLLKHEQKYWDVHIGESKTRKKQIYDLLAFITMMGGLSLKKLDDKQKQKLIKILLKAEILPPDLSQRAMIEYFSIIMKLTGNKSGCLQPDIFAEYFVLKQWKIRKKKSRGAFSKYLLKQAYSLSTDNTEIFIFRSATDFSDNKTAYYWWETLYKQSLKAKKNAKGKKGSKKRSKKANQGKLIFRAFSIIGLLSLKGKYEIVLERWLPLLLKMKGDERNKGRVLNYAGLQNNYLGNYDTALDYFEQSLEIQQAIGDRLGEGMTLNNISAIYDVRGDYETALSYLKQSLAIAQEIGDKLGEGTTLNNTSQIFQARGDYETALSYLKQSLEIRQEVGGDKSGEGTTLNNISQIFQARGDYETALSYLKQSLEIAQKIGDKLGEGTTLNNFSQIFQAQGDYETALSYLKQSLEIRQEVGDKSGESTTLNNISQIYHARGDYETALSYLTQSLEIAQEIGDKSGEGTTLNNISQIYDARGDYETALSYLEQSLEIQQEIGDKSGEGTTLNNISAIYNARGDYETALSYLTQSLEISQEIGDKSGEGRTLNNISQIYYTRGDYETAVSYLKQSLEIRQEIGDNAGMCATLFNMGHIQLQNKQKEKALQTWGKVYALAKPMQLAKILEVLEGLAEHLDLPDGLASWEKFMPAGDE